MIDLLFCSVLFVPNVEPAPCTPSAFVATDDKDLDSKIAAAGRDVAKLLELANSYSTAKHDDDAKKVFAKVLEVDANNEVAHKALNHQFYDKKWFESFAELTKYKREETAKMKAKGLARFKDEWVPEADLPFLQMNWTKDAKGAWSNPFEAARAKQVDEWKAAGYQFRADDNSWIAPGDVDKWSAIQWKCGEQWLDTAAANEYHSKLGQWWELAGDHFVVWTTVDWDGGNIARWHAEKIYPELVRIFGAEPTEKPHFIVLNGLEQYNLAAGGNPPALPESEGFSSLHGAYFSDYYFDAAAKPPQYLGSGVSYWDRKDAKVSGWGPFWLRWAAAQSYADAIDRSWLTIGDRVANGQNTDLAAVGAAFWSEKRIPRWLRWGAASYCERFLKDPQAAEGANPWSLREFAFAELKKNGGLRKLDELFAFGLNLTNLDNSSHMYEEAGLVVSFLLDGSAGDKELAAKHEAFKKALKSGTKKDVADAANALQAELLKHEAAIKKFAGL